MRLSCRAVAAAPIRSFLSRVSGGWKLAGLVLLFLLIFPCAGAEKAYPRGNHDVKGVYSEQLDKFVGSKDGRFYFNFYFKDVYGIVLDLGEDHDDDWWEYYDTAHYVEYHNAQLAFLQEEIDKHEYDAYKYHMVACHIPVPFVNYRHNHENVKPQMTALLNQMAQAFCNLFCEVNHPSYQAPP